MKPFTTRAARVLARHPTVSEAYTDAMMIARDTHIRDTEAEDLHTLCLLWLSGPHSRNCIFGRRIHAVKFSFRAVESFVMARGCPTRSSSQRRRFLHDAVVEAFAAGRVVVLVRAFAACGRPRRSSQRGSSS